MLLEKIISCARLKAVTEVETKIEVERIVSSSANVRQGDMFFAIDGLHTDGHRYVAEAVGRGAAAAVVMKGRGSEFATLGVPILESDNTREALAYALDAVCGFPSKKLKIIAVTGTNGKTSIAFMLRSIFRKAGIRTGLIGTAGVYCEDDKLICDNSDSLANMTTPDPEELYSLLSKMQASNVETVIMEASSHASALGKLAPLSFCASVFSNLTPEHLDLHGTMEEYFKAKRSIINKSEIAVINADDEYGRRLLESVSGTVCVSASVKDMTSDYCAENIRFFGVDGMSYTLCGNGRKTDIQIPVIGEFNVSNSLLAAACSAEMGIPGACIRSALEDFSGVVGRMQRVRDLGVPFSVFIDYAHTPDALQNVLSTFGKIKPECGKLTVLFGCGGDRDKNKRPKMGRIASEIADLVILTSDNSRSEDPEDIIADIKKGFPEGYTGYTIIKDRKTAIEYAVMNASPGDVLVLAGKGHEKYEINRYGRSPFDEEAVVRAACVGYKNKNE